MKRWLALNRWRLLWALIGSTACRVILAIAFRLIGSESAMPGTAKLVVATVFDLALLALAVAATQEAWAAVGYVAVFGLGSILGMAALSFVAAWPLGAAEQHAKWLHRGLSIGAAALAIVLGADVMMETAGTAWGGV